MSERVTELHTANHRIKSVVLTCSVTAAGQRITLIQGTAEGT